MMNIGAKTRDGGALFLQAYLQSVVVRLAVESMNSVDLRAVVAHAIEAMSLAVTCTRVRVVEVTSDGKSIDRGGSESTTSIHPQGEHLERLSVPLPGGIGPVGVMEVEVRQRALSDDEAQFLENVAEIIGGAIQRSRDEVVLKQSESRLLALVEAADDCSLVGLDGDGRIVSWNRGAELIWGHECRDALGCHAAALLTHRSEDETRLRRDLVVALRRGRVERAGWYKDAGGSLFFAATTLIPIRDPVGALLGFAYVCRRLTAPSLPSHARNVERVTRRARAGHDNRGPRRGPRAHA